MNKVYSLMVLAAVILLSGCEIPVLHWFDVMQFSEPISVNDQPNPYDSIRVAVDSTGMPHITYCSVNNIFYSIPGDNSYSSWDTEQIASGITILPAGLSNSDMVMDKEDNVHIVWVEDNFIKYYSPDSTGWDASVDNVSPAFSSPSIAVNSNNIPFIVADNGTTNIYLFAADPLSKSWASYSVSDLFNYNTVISVAEDNIVYLLSQDGTGGLEMVKGFPGSFGAKVAMSTGNFAVDYSISGYKDRVGISSLHRQTAMQLEISVWEMNKGDSLFAAKKICNFKAPKLSDEMALSELRYDAHGFFHLAYLYINSQTPYNWELRYISNRSGIPMMRVLDKGGDNLTPLILFNSHIALAIDQKGFVHIAYFSRKNNIGTLKYITSSNGF